MQAPTTCSPHSSPGPPPCAQITLPRDGAALLTDSALPLPVLRSPAQQGSSDCLSQSSPRCCLTAAGLCPPPAWGLTGTQGKPSAPALKRRESLLWGLRGPCSGLHVSASACCFPGPSTCPGTQHAGTRDKGQTQHTGLGTEGVLLETACLLHWVELRAEPLSCPLAFAAL